MSDHEVITEVPPQLRRLVRLVARAFFQPQHIVVLDVLSTYPCVTEGDLVEVLKMQSAQKQLRQVLTSLKKDKLIKSLQKMESTDIERRRGGGEGGGGGGVGAEGEKHLRMVYYYYINYKQFVNVVKYKLDRMRKAIEAEEKKVQNRTSYICSRCGSTFADLDVDHLFDPSDGNLKCSHCGSVLEEDAPSTSAVDARTLVSRLNDQMKPITDVLRETENINLAPEVLEPEAQSIEKHLQAKGLRKDVAAGGHGKDQQAWVTRKTMDIYGAEQTVCVNIGTEEQLREQNKPMVKERPEWMMYSTVHPSGDLVQEQSSSSSAAAATAGLELAPGVSKLAGHQIIEDLLTYEMKPELGSSVGADAAEYSSSSSDEGGEEKGGFSAPMHTWQTTASPLNSEEGEEEEDSEDEYTMKIGERVVALNEVTDEMVAQMTADEKETYTRLYQQAMSQTEYY